MDERETLRTLQAIEDLLAKSLATGQQQRVTQARRLGGDKKDSRAPDFTSLNKSVLGASANLVLLSKSTGILSKAFADAVSRFSSIDTSEQEAMSKHASTMLGEVSISGAWVRDQFSLLGRSAKTLHETFSDISGKMVAGAVKTEGIKVEAAATEAALAVEAASDAKETNEEVIKSSGMVSRALSSMFGNVKDGNKSFDEFFGRIRSWTVQLRDVLSDVIRDVYNLQARGIQAGNSLTGLYGSVIKAGMSLDEYTAMMEENSAALVRAKSIEDFTDQVADSRKQLAKLGSFGPSATRLVAAINTATVTVGIPQEKLAQATESQVKLFGQLRKSTLMTADAFRDLVADISSNQNVQEDLLGMAPIERQARMQQLMQIGTLGHQMGLTQDASKRLTDALLSQRKATAQQRFQAAGYIRQAGAIIGMGGRETEELAKLRMKKRRTPEEEARFVELSGMMEEGIQRMMNSGNIQAEFIAEKLDEILGSTPQGEVQKAAGQARAQQQAGPVRAEGIGRETTTVQQQIGETLTTISGFMKNPLGEAAITFGSILAQSLMQNFWLSRIAANTSGKGPTASMFDRFFKKAGKPGGPKPGLFRASWEYNKANSPVMKAGRGVMDFAKGGIGNAMKGVGDYLSMIKRISTAYGNSMGIMTMLVDAASTGMNALKSLGSGIKSIFGKGGPLGMAFGFIEELFTGATSEFLGFGDGLGGRLLGAVVAGFNSFFTGITRLFDDGINWILEGLGINFKVNTTRWVDLATSYVTDGFKLILAGLAKSVAAGLEFFGFKNAPWVKSLREAEENIYRSMSKSADNREKLWSDENATMRSIGEAQVKAQQKVADKSQKLVQVTNDNVAYGIDQALTQARAVAATTAQVATPVMQKQVGVTPPEVNKPQVEAKERTAEETSAKKEAALAAAPEALQMAQQQLKVLQDILMAIMDQTASQESHYAATNRVRLSSSADLQLRLNKQT